MTPARALVLSFALLVLLGGLALKIPGVGRIPHLPWIDAFFTAASAVCVTGLVTVDTGTAWNTSGQVIILLLIQMGGLGIMTFSVFFYQLVGVKISLRSEFTVRDTFSPARQQNIPRLIRSVIFFTLLIEAVGVVLLLVCWAGDYPPGKALFLSIFHAVSAFCNAGFSLWPDSLTRFSGRIAVNTVIMFLIVAGGLGFVVISDLVRPKSRTWRLNLHSRIVLHTTLVLILIGALWFITMEWNNVLAGKGFVERVAISFFQAVTPRTAGFNTVEYAHLSNATLLMSMALMFIGGSPGSTAGGIKTVTLALLIALAVSRFRGFTRVNIHKHSVGDNVVSRSLAITLISLAVTAAALAGLLMTESGGLDHTQTRDLFLRLMFETVSAFGTVGLSMGVTPDLTPWGKLIIILTMFLGRVGPLTVAMAFVNRSRSARPYNYSREEVMVG